MRILVLGGTGTIGRPLVKLLSENKENSVFYVSRNENGGAVPEAVHLRGNIFNHEFLDHILSEKYDCIIDFIWYTVETFLPCYKKLLKSTTHYIGMSSGAVCADSDQPITEDMPRVIDICSDEKKGTSREYHMEKARIEDILKDSYYRNWTLIRLHVTYNANRLPLFVWEKEQWFYRILQGHTIVLTKDMMDKRTVLTYGGDVARVISMLIKKEGAYGQVINVTSDQSMKRSEIVVTYQKIFEESFHQKMKIRYLENVEELRRAFPYQADRMDNDRMLNRVYDTTKLKSILGGGEYHFF